MHQSFRPLTMGRMRFAPEAGMKVTSSSASRASSRNPSTLANHCAVARKIVGFFVRQSYGYLCPYASSSKSAPEARSASTHASFPSPKTFFPSRSAPASAVKSPASSTGLSSGKPCLRPVR